MNKVAFFCVLGLSFLAGACGFEPMYAPSRDSVAVQEEFAAIAIAPIPDRIGQVVHNGLLDRLNPLGHPDAPRFRLDVTLETTREGFGFRPDESITRENLRLKADYRLIRVSDGEVVLDGSARSNLAYDIVQSDFANFAAQKDAELRTAEQVVNTIVARLGLFVRARGSQG